MWSQIVTTSGKSNGSGNEMTALRYRAPRYRPFAFTEHGAMMAATVLNSPEAVRMSVFVVRAFIKMREELLHRVEWERQLAAIEKTLLSHDSALRDLYAKIRPLLLPPPEPERQPFGFSVREPRAIYRAKENKRKVKET